MPKAYKQHKRRVVTHRKRRRTSSVSIWIGVSLILLTLAVGWWISHNPKRATHIVYDPNYQVTGTPSVDADFINQVLDTYNSPAHGKGQTLYTLGVKYGIDPVYALAFFLQESRFGTTGVARVTLSLGNIRTTAGYDDYEGYRKYSSWEDGFDDWYKLIKVQYVDDWALLTVNQIIPVYAPSTDNNDVVAYIRGIKSAVDSWRNGQVEV